MAARDRETVAPEAEAPGRSAAPQPEYRPSPGTRPWLRRPVEPENGPEVRELLPPPAPRRGFHAGSADVPRGPGRRGGDQEELPGVAAGWTICGSQRGGAGRGLSGWAGPSRLPYLAVTPASPNVPR